jgi:hypothetical protein
MAKGLRKRSAVFYKVVLPDSSSSPAKVGTAATSEAGDGNQQKSSQTV